MSMRQDQLIFNFHGMFVQSIADTERAVPADEIPYWISRDRFEEILRLIREQDPSGKVHFTFDDGNRSDAVIALPLLLAYGFKASFFISTDLIGAKGYLSEADIIALRDAGMGIGSHGSAHIRWTSVEHNLTDEIAQSLRRLTDITGAPITEVAIPFGAYNFHVLRTLRRLGISRAYTSDGGYTHSGRWLAARNSVRSDTSLDTISHMIKTRPGLARRLRSRASQAKKSASGLLPSLFKSRS